MKRYMLFFLNLCFIVCLTVCGILELGAQDEAAQPVSSATDPADQTQQTGQNQTAEEGIASPDTFIYLPRGRRDPFWDLLGNAKAGKDAKGREAIPGIAGLMIDELELDGIIFISDKYFAAMKGPDSQPYLVTVGESVYDGEIVKIDSHSVVFKKILTIAIGGATERYITKRLNPEEEQEK